MANMVAIATLIDICEQRWIEKRYLTETNIKFLFLTKEIFLFVGTFILLFA